MKRTYSLPASVMARRISTPRSVNAFSHAGSGSFWSDRPFDGISASSSSSPPVFGFALVARLFPFPPSSEVLAFVFGVVDLGGIGFGNLCTARSDGNLDG